MDTAPLTGTVALVTGGSRGLGRQFARSLAEAGAAVAVLARQLDGSEAVATELRSEGVSAMAVAADVTDRGAVEDAVARIEGTLGPVDVLVNNAGISSKADALDVTVEDWRRVLAVNLDGVWNCSQIVGRGMVARRRGSIVNIGSMSGVIVNRPQNQPAYNASKAAVHHLTRSLAAEWAPAGVRVNAIAPGYVKTDMSPVDHPDLQRWWIEDAPMRRYAVVDEFGPAVVFLASDASSFMTGAVLVMDGGYSLF
ncbi:MAG TPA: SDR family oxidoreductase [Lapillicoccus sp.]|jgi:NAD(P)-dependent dehydrogenase (short-subunit alcohol dehydrogenase family)|uniref:SDR family NAD(P)-dependent oxidoreductase n=1 Tax=Lapillicoccus sp. TaxID=1909287 RepID=UPI002F935EC5